MTHARGIGQRGGFLTPHYLHARRSSSAQDDPVSVRAALAEAAKLFEEASVELVSCNISPPWSQAALRNCVAECLLERNEKRC